MDYVWAPNDALLGSVRILFEISITGAWSNTIIFDAMPSKTLLLEFNNQTMMEIMMVLFVLYYISEEFSQFCTSKRNYLKDGWNIIDWVNLFLLVCFIILRSFFYLALNDFSIASSALDTRGTYTDLSRALNLKRQYRAISSINVVLIFVKVAKYLRGIPYIATLVLTIRHSWKYFLSAAFIMMTAFFGLSLGLFTAFGDKFDEYKDLLSSLTFVAKTLKAKATLNVFMESFPGGGGIISIFFALLLQLFLLNLFFALMVAAFGDAKTIMASMRHTNPFSLDDLWRAQHMLMEHIHRVWSSTRVREVRYAFVHDILKPRFPLVYHYLVRREGKQAYVKEENQRMVDEREWREVKRVASLAVVGGPGSESDFSGRRKKDKKKRSSEEWMVKNADSSSDSELDLGPLSVSEIKKRKERTVRGGTRGGEDEPSEVFIDAITQVVGDFNSRGIEVRRRTLDEVGEIMSILKDQSCVMEILTKRCHDLHTQQAQFLGTAH